MKKKASFFGRVEILPEPNLFIGGVGATTVTSAADLATKFSFGVSAIENFQIDADNNVSCYINSTTFSTVKSATFTGDLNLTYFIDLEGKFRVSTTSAAWSNFSNNYNNLYFYAPNTTVLGFHGAQGGMSKHRVLKKINVENATSIRGKNLFNEFWALKKLDLRSGLNMTLFSANYTSFTSLTNIYRLYLGSVTSMLTNFGYSRRFFYNINNGATVYISSFLGTQDRQSWNEIEFTTDMVSGDEFTINGLVYTAVTGAPTTDGEFEAHGLTVGAQKSNLRNAINSDTRTGTLGTVSAINNVSETTKLTVYSDQTGVGANAVTISINGANGGSATLLNTGAFFGGNDINYHVMIARERYNLNIVEVTAPITVNAPSNVTVSNITATTAQINFTEPAANAKGTGGYEVWLDDGGVVIKHFEYQEVSGTGQVITGLESGKTYKVKVRTFDGHYDFSDFSNEYADVEFTTL